MDVDKRVLMRQSARFIARKGRVREAIIELLAQQPRTLTEIASLLGVSKPTVSYHLAELSEQGVVEVSSIKVVRGGVVSKLYSLHRKPMVIASSFEEEGVHVQALWDVFERKRLEWDLDEGVSFKQDLTLLLFHTFRIIRNISKTRHDELLYKLGLEVGKRGIAKHISGRTIKETLTSLREFVERTGIGSFFITRSDGVYLVECLDFLDVHGFDEAVCAFVKGLIDGVLEAKHGPLYNATEAGDVSAPDSCVFVIRRRNS